MIPLITIEGATATGKSAFAIELAEMLKTEIISADSRQVYRYMDIGTAKVTSQERERIPHHLIDIIDPSESYNAGLFCTEARAKISELRTKGMLPIICGGTGLYIRSLLQGLCELPVITLDIRSALEARLQIEGLTELYHELVMIDPQAAAKISSNDPQRTLRALEVYQATGKPISLHWEKQSRQTSYIAFRILIELPREQLYERINSRITMMLEAGLLDEIRGLIARGYTKDDAGLKCMGYKEFIPYIHGICTLPDAEALAAQHQRNLAKRQMTWYRKCSFDLTLDARSISLSGVNTMIKDFLIEADDADNS